MGSCLAEQALVFRVLQASAKRASEECEIRATWEGVEKKGRKVPFSVAPIFRSTPARSSQFESV